MGNISQEEARKPLTSLDIPFGSDKCASCRYLSGHLSGIQNLLGYLKRLPYLMGLSGWTYQNIIFCGTLVITAFLGISGRIHGS